MVATGLGLVPAAEVPPMQRMLDDLRRLAHDGEHTNGLGSAFHSSIHLRTSVSSWVPLRCAERADTDR